MAAPAAAAGGGAVTAARARLRDVTCTLGELHRAHGCARYAHGGTSVLCSVSGPVAVRWERNMRMDRGIVQVVIRGRDATTRGAGTSRLEMDSERWQESLESCQMSGFLRRCLESVVMLGDMPRSQLVVTAHVLSNDGGLSSVLINAAMLAVLDAGLPCRGVLGAAEVCTRVDGDSRTMLLDPTQAEIAASDSHGLFVHMADGSGLVASRTAGPAMSSDLFWAYHATTQKAAGTLAELFRRWLKESKATAGPAPADGDAEMAPGT